MNQVIIFFPFIILLLVRKHSLSTAWIPSHNILLRLGGGIFLALISIISLILVRQPAIAASEIFLNVYHPTNLGYAVPIFLEDVALAMLLVRLQCALRKKRFFLGIITVAFLFSASHYSLHLQEGLSFFAAAREVLLNWLLVSAAIYVLQRSQDILWFWCVYLAMDMMQFYAGNPTSCAKVISFSDLTPSINFRTLFFNHFSLNYFITS